MSPILAITFRETVLSTDASLPVQYPPGYRAPASRFSEGPRKLLSLSNGRKMRQSRTNTLAICRLLLQQGIQTLETLMAVRDTLSPLNVRFQASHLINVSKPLNGDVTQAVLRFQFSFCFGFGLWAHGPQERLVFAACKPQWKNRLGRNPSTDSWKCCRHASELRSH